MRGTLISEAQQASVYRKGEAGLQATVCESVNQMKMMAKWNKGMDGRTILNASEKAFVPANYR
jgi:hypothetical protein